MKKLWQGWQTMPKIKLKLNVASINQALSELEAYTDKVQKAAAKTVELAAEMGAAQAKDYAAYMNIYDTGALVNGIMAEVNGEKGAVLSTAPHSAFCEFGTGVRGEDKPHPEPGLVGWRYDVNQHGEMGWWYFDGEWHWTAGMPSRPYMYNTALWLRQHLPAIAKEALK